MGTSADKGALWYLPLTRGSAAVWLSSDEAAVIRSLESKADIKIIGRHRIFSAHARTNLALVPGGRLRDGAEARICMEGGNAALVRRVRLADWQSPETAQVVRFLVKHYLGKPTDCGPFLRFLSLASSWRVACDLKFAESDIGCFALQPVAPSLVCPELSCYLVTGNTVEHCRLPALSVDGDQALLLLKLPWPIKIFAEVSEHLVEIEPTQFMRNKVVALEWLTGLGTPTLNTLLDRLEAIGPTKAGNGKTIASLLPKRLQLGTLGALEIVACIALEGRIALLAELEGEQLPEAINLSSFGGAAQPAAWKVLADTDHGNAERRRKLVATADVEATSDLCRLTLTLGGNASSGGCRCRRPEATRQPAWCGSSAIRRSSTSTISRQLPHPSRPRGLGRPPAPSQAARFAWRSAAGTRHRGNR